MSKAKYGIGDMVILNDGPLRHARRDTEFKILAVLPESDGQVQYQVRSEAEGFDRRIAASEIDVDRSAISNVTRPTTAVKAAQEPWFKPSSIKITK